MSDCPCGSGQSYEKCCGPIHTDHTAAKSAESLMRARYCAFTKSNIDFIGLTHVPGTEDFDPKEAKDWAENSIWKKLEIVKTQKGQEADKNGVVEFKAYYADQSGKDYIHHEVATFSKIEDKWYYKDGQIVGLGPIKRVEPKIGRNDPCSCGSGKKFKKCCGQ